MIFLDSMTTKFVKTRLFFLIAKLALLACAIKKANLLKYIFFFPQNSDPERIKICLGKSYINSYQVLEIQTQPTLLETLALG